MSTISPLISPAPATIGSLGPEVCTRLENRQADLSRSYVWLKDSLIELTTNTQLRDDFDELEVWTSEMYLNETDTEYPFSDLMPALTDAITGSAITTLNMATLDMMIWVDPPTNSRRVKLDMTHYQQADKASFPTSTGRPAEWYRFGDAIGFSPKPDAAYKVQGRILRYHPINTVAPETTPILLNSEWHDILIWMAVQRGFMELQEFSKANSIRVMLHGDPEDPGKLGLVQSTKKRHKREAFRSSGRLRPRIRNYGWGR